MKRLKHIVFAFVAGLMVLAGCDLGKAPGPVDGPPSELAAIDSLMWQRPDSALQCLLTFRDAMLASSNTTDGDFMETHAMRLYNEHYYQLLAAELLYKNDYDQTNRTELQQVVAYFDSLCGRDGVHTVSTTVAFLDARAHYINGVGYYERDSLIEACGEYLDALRMMESHFAENELVGKKARFMSLTYNRLLDLFSYQLILMPELAIVCAKQSLAYNKIAPTSKYGESILYGKIGLQYDVLEEPDSAAYYYDKALEVLPDRNTLAYRDMLSSWAFCQHKHLGHTQIALDTLKSLVAKATDDNERITRYMSIGMVYVDIGQSDSAKLYLGTVFETDPVRAIIAAKPLKDIALSEGDTLKANEYALALANVGASAADNQFLVSKLNGLFQSYLQEKQEAASLRERKKTVRLTLMVLVPLLVSFGLAVAIVMWRRHRKRLAAQEAEAQQRQEADRKLEAVQRQLADTHDALKEKEWEALVTKVNAIFNDKQGNTCSRIIAAFEATYPQFAERLHTAYPDLTETERHLVVLKLLHFRAKEEAALLNLTENTVLKYRSQLNKKVDFGQISTWIG